ncbi:hypothetical protein ABH942_003330 [Flavobacterium sp. 28YEA47A]|uniref:hypothetical protein n=1 Tax=Flavobacterium sp. 28YEA47A TaxID=3156276 RepID=UPI00351247FC
MKNLNEIFQSFEAGMRSPKAVKPKAYLQNIGLDYNTLRIGFNSGQFHHRVSQELKDHYESMGLLAKSNAAVRDDSMTAYTAFGRYSITFPLLDVSGKIVNLFAVRFEMASPIEQYLNEEGLYPSYPHDNTRRLFIVSNALDAASLLQSRAMENREAVLALHEGRLLPQHLEAIRSLHELEEIIIIKN